MLKLGQDNGFAADYTEDVAQLSSAGRLLPYNAVMFLSTTRDTLDCAANANFYDHAANQPGTVITTDRRDASTQELPPRWAFTDEWYDLVPFPTRVRVLAKVDESTPARGVRGDLGHPGHGGDHPVSWCQYYDGGRAWLATLGHDVKAWTDEPLDGDQHFVRHLLGGVKSVMGMAPFCR